MHCSTASKFINKTQPTLSLDADDAAITSYNAHHDAAELLVKHGLLSPGTFLTEQLFREINLCCVGNWSPAGFSIRGRKDVPVTPAYDGTAYRVGGVLVPYAESDKGGRLYAEAYRAKMPYMFAVEKLTALLMPLAVPLTPEAKLLAQRLISRAGHSALLREEIARVGDHLYDNDVLDVVQAAAEDVRKEVSDPKLKPYFFVAPHHDQVVKKMPVLISVLNGALNVIDGASPTVEATATWQAQIHNAIIRIRPFDMGNGRVARLIANVAGWRMIGQDAVAGNINRPTIERLYNMSVANDMADGSSKQMTAFFSYHIKANLKTRDG